MLKPFNKKGQVTFYVLVGIIIVVIVLILLFFSSHIWSGMGRQKLTEEIAFSQAVENVRSYVQSTIDVLAEEGVIILGRQGGLINLKEDYVTTDYSNISNYLPEKEVLSKELSNYISQNLKNNLVFENKTFYTVETGDRIITKTVFTENEIKIETVFSVTVKAGNGTERKLDPFKTTLKVRMDKIYDIAKSVVEDETISYAENLENMKLSVYKEGDIKVYVLTDKKSEVRGKRYRFLFTKPSAIE